MKRFEDELVGTTWGTEATRAAGQVVFEVREEGRRRRRPEAVFVDEREARACAERVTEATGVRYVVARFGGGMMGGKGEE